jgi:hypothetical protein
MTVDDSDGEIDELLLQSSPKEPAPIEELFNVQIGVSPIIFTFLSTSFMLITEVPQFPRARNIGGYAGIEPHILAGKTLVSFR